MLQHGSRPHPCRGPATVRRELKVLGRSHPVLMPIFCPLDGGVRGAHLGVRMVGHHGQHRNHRLLLVSPPRAQTALPSPPRGSRFAVSHEPPARIRLERTPKRKGTLESDALLLLFLSRHSERECASTTPANFLCNMGTESPGSRDSRRLRYPFQPSSTHRCECSRAPKKNRLAQKIRTLNMLKRYRRLVEIMYRFPLASREQKKNQLYTSLQTADIHGNTARGASIPAKPVRNMPLPLSTMCRPQWEEEQDVHRAREPSQPLHVENRKFLPKATLDDA